MSREAGQETCHERRPPNTDPMGRGEQSRTCFVPNAQPAALPSLQRWDWALEAEGLSFLKGYGLLRLGEIFQSTAYSSRLSRMTDVYLKVSRKVIARGCAEKEFLRHNHLRSRSIFTYSDDDLEISWRLMRSSWHPLCSFQ